MLFLAQEGIPQAPPGLALPYWLQVAVYVLTVLVALGSILTALYQKIQALRKGAQLDAVITGVEQAVGPDPHPVKAAIQAAAIDAGVEEGLAKAVEKVKDTARLARPEDPPH